MDQQTLTKVVKCYAFGKCGAILALVLVFASVGGIKLFGV